MANILILFAHPAFEKSRVHARMLHRIQEVRGITVNDLYEAYPDFDIDVKREQDLLLAHDIIIWQHPFYWYSAPAMIKQWQDLVLEHGWAYGSGGTALTGKKIFNAISTGGPEFVYTKGGRNRFTIREFLAPFDQTAGLCKMNYLPPFVVHGTHKLTGVEIETHAEHYGQLLEAMRDERIPGNAWLDAQYLNEIISTPTIIT
jgi:glutathione-regulated potassium-efflux system ancillary protein KefG